MAEFHIALSAVGNGLSLLLAAVLARHAWRWRAARVGVALLVASVGYSLILLHETATLPSPGLVAAVVLNAFSAPLGWLFGRLLLQDEARIGRRDGAVSALLVALALAADADVFGVDFAPRVVFEILSQAAAFAVMAHVSWLAASGFRDDLVDARRVARAGFLLLVTGSYVLMFALDLAGAPVAARAAVYDLTSVAIVVSVALWGLSVRADRLFPAEAPPVRAPEDPRRRRERLRLLALMEEERLYREPGLTLRGLAERTGVPEHRLRALINGALGHRNFAAFLNGYRLAEARAALADPRNEASILVIALDCGYQSLSTFNRAFRRAFDETPSEFRRRSTAEAAEADAAGAKA